MNSLDEEEILVEEEQEPLLEEDPEKKARRSRIFDTIQIIASLATIGITFAGFLYLCIVPTYRLPDTVSVSGKPVYGRLFTGVFYGSTLSILLVIAYILLFACLHTYLFFLAKKNQKRKYAELICCSTAFLLYLAIFSGCFIFSEMGTGELTLANLSFVALGALALILIISVISIRQELPPTEKERIDMVAFISAIVSSSIAVSSVGFFTVYGAIEREQRKNATFTNDPFATSIVIEEGTTTIKNETFSYFSHLESVKLPSTLVSIGEYAFEYCTSLREINFPDSLKSIGASAFYGCKALTSLDLPNGITSIARSAFSACSSLTSINIPTSLTSIESEAFGYCYALSYVDIPSNIVSIGGDAFIDCKSLSYVVVPNSITSIGSFAFDDCESLEFTFYKGSLEEWSNITIGEYNDKLEDNLYLYSENKPSDNEHRYWRYVDNKPTAW